MKYRFLLFPLFAMGIANAQTQDSVSLAKKAIAFTADKFDFAKPLNVSFSQATPYDYSVKSKSGSFPDGEVTNMSQVKASFNYNFIQKKKWLLGATVGYEMTSISAESENLVNDSKQKFEDDFHFHYSSLNFTYFSKLFDKRMIYTSSVIVDGSDKHFERVKGLATATMVLKADKKTKMMVGLVAVIDPSSQIPILPTFSYERKFGNGWTADILLPQRLLMKKDLFAKGRLSFGTELGATRFYLYDKENADKKYEFRQTELNNGIIYEHLLGKYFVLTAKTGLKYVPNARVFEKNESFKDYLYEIKPDPTFYFNVGISFNPFFKK